MAARKKARTAKQKAADKKNGARLKRLNKARAAGTLPKVDGRKMRSGLAAAYNKGTKHKTTPKKGKKLSRTTFQKIAERTGHVPLDVLKRRAMHSAETLVKAAREAGVSIDQIPEYRPKGRR